MKKLELKHVKGYLGTNLKGLIFYPHSDDETCTLKIKNGFNNDCDINYFINGTYQIKPILRPLSDLTKEIEVNGGKFVPILKYTADIQEELSACLRDSTYYELLPYFVIQKLYEWHFDIHGLIEKGLAIDTNTINNGIQ